MDVSAASVSAVTGTQGAEAMNPASARARLQIAMLKKALDSQKDQVAELMRATEGKGQILDIQA